MTRVRMCWVRCLVSSWGWQMREVSCDSATSHTYMGRLLLSPCISAYTSALTPFSCAPPTSHATTCPKQLRVLSAFPARQ